MWDDTIFVVANDNGGPVCIGGGRGQAAGDGGACGADIGYRGDIAGGGGGGGGGVASNWPLRGAKHSVWEGGVRGNSFVAGGALHPDLSGRGNRYEGLMHLMDWHAIFLRLSGFHDHVVRETHFDYDPFTRNVALKMPQGSCNRKLTIVYAKTGL